MYLSDGMHRVSHSNMVYGGTPTETVKGTSPTWSINKYDHRVQHGSTQGEGLLSVSVLRIMFRPQHVAL